jgi:hypothetical protein
MKFNQILANKVEELEQSTLQNVIDNKLTSIFANTEFYCSRSNITDCDENNPRYFQYLIGLPKNKCNETNPLLYYQRQLYDIG